MIHESEKEASTGSKIPVLLSAEPGLLRDSINTILESFRFISIVGATTDAHDCLDLVQQYHPKILLLVCSLNERRWVEILPEVQNLFPEIKCVAITDTFTTSRLAQELGADEIIFAGFTSLDLQIMFKRIIRVIFEQTIIQKV
jgi:DNA-binding NarL/FixJ family response regulator